MRAITSFVLDDRELQAFKPPVYTAVCTPWQLGDQAFLTTLAKKCLAKKMIPCLVIDQSENLSDYELQKLVHAADDYLSKLVPVWWIRCGVEIQPGLHTWEQQQAIWERGKLIASASRAARKFAPPILCWNNDLDKGVASIVKLYDGSALPFEPSMDYYTDYRMPVDDAFVLGCFKRAFKGCGIAWSKVIVLETGMNAQRAGKMTVKQAYDRQMAAVVASGIVSICVFCSWDWGPTMTPDQSFALLKSDFSAGPIMTGIPI